MFFRTFPAILSAFIGAVARLRSCPLRRNASGDRRPDVSAEQMAALAQAALHHLNGVHTALAPSRDAEIRAAAAGFETAALSLLEALRSVPSAVGANRRHLGLFLQGAQEAADRYGDLEAQGAEGPSRQAFLDFLTDLERSYITKCDSIRLRNNAALAIDLSVLRDALRTEAPRTP